MDFICTLGCGARVQTKPPPKVGKPLRGWLVSLGPKTPNPEGRPGRGWFRPLRGVKALICGSGGVLGGPRARMGISSGEVEGNRWC